MEHTPLIVYMNRPSINVLKVPIIYQYIAIAYMITVRDQKLLAKHNKCENKVLVNLLAEQEWSRKGYSNEVEEDSFGAKNDNQEDGSSKLDNEKTLAHYIDEETLLEIGKRFEDYAEEDMNKLSFRSLAISKDSESEGKGDRTPKTLVRCNCKAEIRFKLDEETKLWHEK
ncbi:hypothetical protein Cgig2_028310 [Carnegiea gigantea]|uniref:Uncharacterized protein n=1 Tax=Carnegiea gigantea TaxID=171969 RepID=A0A9Q1GS88_9CARY|nr:hypothetical protein Cgig2_028310 [Carnegiea gigantea]